MNFKIPLGLSQRSWSSALSRPLLCYSEKGHPYFFLIEFFPLADGIPWLNRGRTQTLEPLQRAGSLLEGAFKDDLGHTQT